jgi:hypothetical protein
MPLDVKRSTFCNVIFVVLTGLLAAVLFPDRPSRFDYDLLDQTVMDADVPLARHRDPLRMKIDRSLVPDMLELGPTGNVVGTQEARSFIDSEILPSFDKPTADDAKKFYETLEGRLLTPLHATMMLMGCYGYVYGDPQHDVAGVKSTYHYLQDSALWKPYTTPFMLQALEDKYATNALHDRSVCSCMKDFASPTLVTLEQDDKPLEKAVQDKLLDTCSVQNTIDYALAGVPNEVVGAAKPDVSKSVMLMPMAASDVSKRQRLDPLWNLLVDTLQAGANNDAIQDENKLAFIRAYCDLGSAACTALPVATSALATLTNKQFLDFLKERVTSVKAHNKLRPPKLCSGAGAPAKCPAQQPSSRVATVSTATYNAYLEKYRHSFHMCLIQIENILGTPPGVCLLLPVSRIKISTLWLKHPRVAEEHGARWSGGPTACPCHFTMSAMA